MIRLNALNVRTDFSGMIQTQFAKEFQQLPLLLIVITIWKMMRLNACIVLTDTLPVPIHNYVIRE